MAAIVNVNGRMSSDRDAVISVFDHGFLYGEGVYDTLRTYGGRPFLLDRHLTRLRTSAEMLRLPVPLTNEEFAGRISETARVAARELSPASDWYVRILLTRGVGELTYDPRACPKPSVVIIVKPHVDPPAGAYEQGIPVIFASVIRNHPASVNPIIKSNNLLNNAIAMQEAMRRNAHEAIMLNHRGELCECTQSNLFVVRNGAALTPPISAGLLPGITREFVFEVGEQEDIPVREEILRDEDLFGADEAFLTSSTREVMPIVLVDNRAIGDGRPGPVTARLLDGFRRRARAVTANVPRL
jgi:branched-chain amino acid aminotransferase